MEYDTAELESMAMTLRTDMWRTVCDDAVLECGIEEAWFGPVQATVIEVLPDSPLINVVLGAAEPGAVECGHLAAAVRWIEGFDVDYRVPVARSRPGMSAAEDWLNRHGFEQGRGLVKYVRNASPPDFPSIPGMKVWEIGQEEAHGETMVFAAAPALGLPSEASDLLFSLPIQPHWRTYTVELEEDIVAFGSMLIDDGIAEICLDATVERARRRGCNQALLRQRILDAAACGCHTLFAELEESAEEAGRGLIRAGFVPAYHSMNWQCPR